MWLQCFDGKDARQKLIPNNFGNFLKNSVQKFTISDAKM